MARIERGIYSRETRSGTVYDAVVTVNGRQKWIRGHKTPKKARDARDETAVSMRTGQLGSAPARLTLGQYIEKRWLPSKEGDLGSAETVRSYKYMVSLIVAKLGDVRLAKLTPLDVEEFKTWLRSSRTRGANTNHLAYSVLSQALKQALRWGIIARNPCDQVTPPRKTRYTPPDLETEMIKKVLAAAEGTHHATLVFTAVMTGMRFGELAALLWSDIDMKTGLLRIKKSKTPKGIRTVALGPLTLKRLETHHLEQMKFFTDRNTPPPRQVFLSELGHTLAQSNFIKPWHSIRDAAGVPTLRFHDLRHIQATLLARAGVHPKIAQDRLGHTDSKMTLDVYTHMTADDQGPAAQAVEALLRDG